MSTEMPPYSYEIPINYLKMVTYNITFNDL